MPDSSTTTGTRTTTTAHPFAGIVLRRVLRPLWNALVIYGTLWLPTGQYRLRYMPDGTVVPHPIDEPEVPGGGDRIQPDRETLRAS